MKSDRDGGNTTFHTLQTRLLHFLSSRIDNGDFTERGLARLIGVSQPQFHNVLKGKRKLQTELADRILQKFNMTILDLLEEEELREQLTARSRHQAEGHWEAIRHQEPSTGVELCPRKPSGREIASRSPVRNVAS